ncbi:predicted protein [Plenodomus lingam JN3]|uniref:Predicted protein n=1 Tax=Leptosphaeria maculans (strain JN3 / isolate v23.1.3 / race Av1-4-5-6-7-8) TaxID=985895 RepID=E5AEQ3_LEPMJ|nr:predicted protein [Plenodomus lingam JN3]CBY01692.1 predicted protein [Plenodomus lingam JN3]
MCDILGFGFPLRGGYCSSFQRRWITECVDLSVLG